MKMRKEYSAAGFTLIEVIVTLVVLALTVGMMATYFGTAISRSSDPIGRLISSTNQNSAQQIMEKITAQYSQIPHWHSGTVYAANDIVIPTTPNANGYQYTTSSSGTSDVTIPAVEPSWPIASGGTVTDGSITWTRSANCAPTLISSQCPTSPSCTCSTDLQTSINTNPANIFSTGSYTVNQNEFIKFDPTNSNTELTIASTDTAYGRYLKVRITDPNGSTRAALFVKR